MKSDFCQPYSSNINRVHNNNLNKKLGINKIWNFNKSSNKLNNYNKLKPKGILGWKYFKLHEEKKNKLNTRFSSTVKILFK